MAEHTLISRRQLLGAGCLLVALSPAGLAQAAAAPTAEPGLESFLAIHADNSVTFFSGKVDLGTGLRVALPQIIAEELDVPIETIVMVEGDTARTPNQGSTAGSSTISRTGVQLRQVAATARKALLQMAAQTYGVAPEALTIDRGVVRERGGQGRSIGIGQLLGGKQLSLAIDPSAPVKNPRDYKVVGQSLPRPDLPAKCTGAHTFLQDVSVPGMLHGRVIRPAGLGARLISVDEASLAGIPDVRVVRINNFLGVVAKDEWAAVRAARALKAEWSAVTNLPGSDNLAVKLRAIPIARDEVVSTKGDAAAGLAAATTRLEQT